MLRSVLTLIFSVFLTAFLLTACGNDPASTSGSLRGSSIYTCTALPDTTGMSCMSLSCPPPPVYNNYECISNSGATCTASHQHSSGWNLIDPETDCEDSVWDAI